MKMPRSLRRFRYISIAFALIVVGVALWMVTPAAQAVHTPPPTSVTIAGSLQSELGCPGDWQPDCALTHLGYDPADDVWQGAWTIPAGAFEYKAALNDGWGENYGQNATQNGPNIPLTLASPTTVKFYYDHKSHWVTDNVNSVIPTAPGSYQDEIGCPGDWQPDCLRSWLQDPDGDGIYSFATDAIPAGNYEVKVAIDESWAENYGAGGVPNGPNIPFTVPNGAVVTFTYDAATHILTVDVAGPAGHSHDNNVEYFGLGHNSQDSLYRVPFGAITPGTPVTLRFRTYHNDVTGVRVRFWDDVNSSEFFQDMTLAATDVSCYDPNQPDETCDLWQTEYTPSQPNTVYYRFIVTDGTATAYYADDNFKDGGWGEATPNLIDNSYVITVYDPAFQPVEWLQNAVVYQIFPDRFRNGRHGNDPDPTEPRYGYPADPLDQIINKAWTDLPEGYCRFYDNPADPCTEQPRGRDYFGGDLRGIRKQLKYLEDLGVTAIYLNPIFESASNHGYDTQDYYQIDHFFGTDKDFKKLVKEAHKRGIRIILDGVFNHVSSDSPYFDRYGHFDDVGACESVTSPYRDWFFFRDVAPGTGPCAGTAGPNSATYDAWFGFDSLPVLDKNNPQVRDLVYAGDDAVARYWLDKGADGWRLDVMGDSSFPSDFWPGFRDAVKATRGDAPIIGELWKKGETLPKVRGDQADTTMNYRFRNAILGFFGTVDNKGFPDDGQSDQPPSLFARKLMSIREDYPDATYYTLLNLMDSHDTKRILWSLTPGANNREDKEFNPVNLAQGKQLLKLATIVQMTMPGAPTIFYGDEVGVTGDDDPDDRRTFPTARKGKYKVGGDADLLDHYEELIELRADHEVFRQGDVTFVLTDDANRTLAYLVRTENEAALVAINRSSDPKTLQIDVTGLLPANVNLIDALESGLAVTGAGGVLSFDLPGLSAAILLPAPGQDLTAPAAPVGLTAVAGNGVVDLSWAPVGDAASYNVYRSPVSGGGYTLLTTLPGVAYSDTDVINGKRYYYVVRAVDAAGNEGAASNEAGATPFYPVGYAVLQWPKTLDHTLGVAPTGNIYGQVYVAGITDAGGDPASIWAQIGFGAPGSDPSAWTTWADMDHNAGCSCGNNFEYFGTLRPEQVGTFDLLVRFSTDGGIHWAYGDQDGFYPGEPGTDMPGVLTVLPNPDTTPPVAPANLHVTDWSSGFISLAWDPVSDAAEYWIYRRQANGAFGQPIAKIPAADTTYTDSSVASGIAYTYAVRAVDAALNLSSYSNEVTQTAQPKIVNVTFRVRVPDETPSTDTVYIPGNIDLLGPWNPGKQAMNNLGGGIWEVTLPIPDGVNLEYKYTRGSWEQVEWWGSITGVTNRHVTISYGTDGNQLVDNTATDWGNGPDEQKAVQFWRDPLVASTSPANGATLPAPASVTVAFSRAIQPQTGADFSGSVAVSANGAPVAGTVSPLSGSTTNLTWTPAAPLAPGSYTVTVFNLRSDIGGDSVPMQAPYVFIFTVTP